MALLSVIRRWHFREKLSVREIARRTKLSRNTIAKYLASGETEPRYPKRHSPSQLDPYAADLPDGFRRLQAVLLKRPGGDREMVEILALVLNYDEQAVLAAVELALEAGAPSKPHILNLLHRLLGADPPQPMDAPPTLALQVEPQANASRYDGLREARHVA